MGSIFISYRRDDSAATCGRIYDRLVGHFGKAAIFKDVDSIPLGVNFEQYIGGVVQQCSVLLAVIGPQWLDIRSASGQRRPDEPGDVVRLEIEAALQRGIPVIPVLVQGAAIPPADALPPSLRELVMRNGMPVRYDPAFDGDIRQLAVALERWVPAAAASVPAPVPAFVGAQTAAGAAHGGYPIGYAPQPGYAPQTGFPMQPGYAPSPVRQQPQPLPPIKGHPQVKWGLIFGLPLTLLWCAGVWYGSTLDGPALEGLATTGALPALISMFFPTLAAFYATRETRRRKIGFAAGCIVVALLLVPLLLIGVVFSHWISRSRWGACSSCLVRCSARPASSPTAATTGR